MDKIKDRYLTAIISILVGSFATFTVTQGTNIAKSVENWLTYPIFNSELDSLQTVQIKNLRSMQDKFCTKKEVLKKDSVVLRQLREIGTNQKIFQNKVIERYDKKVDVLENNQAKIFGMLEALRFMTYSWEDTANSAIVQIRDTSFLNKYIKNTN